MGSAICDTRPLQKRDLTDHRERVYFAVNPFSNSSDPPYRPSPSELAEQAADLKRKMQEHMQSMVFKHITP